MKKIAFLLLAVIAALLLTALPALADCDGAGVITCTTRDLSGIVLSDGNDNLTIQSGVRVRNSIGNGVDAGYGDDSILNQGDISSKVRGIFGDTGNDTLVNRGSIVDGDAGIYGGIGNDSIENSGRIVARVVGIEAADVDALADFDTVTNSGNINSTSGDGILSYGRVVNSGRVNARDDGLVGVDVTNSGRVIVYGGNAIRGTNATDDRLVNEASGYLQGVNGINGFDGNDVIINSGAVIGGLHGWSGDDTITLLAGTVQGEIDCGQGIDTLIIAFSVPASQLADLSAQIVPDPDEGRGSLTIGRNTYNWRWCENVVNQMTGR